MLMSRVHKFIYLKVVPGQILARSPATADDDGPFGRPRQPAYFSTCQQPGFHVVRHRSAKSLRVPDNLPANGSKSEPESRAYGPYSMREPPPPTARNGLGAGAEERFMNTFAMARRTPSWPTSSRGETNSTWRSSASNAWRQVQVSTAAAVRRRGWRR